MDFKVAGTEDGITALQMDIKVGGITTEVMRKALDQARRGWLEPARVLNTRPWSQLAKLLARA